jgi:hypothetical protein
VGQSVSVKPGTTIIAADCAGLTTSNNGGTQANQTAGEFWAVAGATLVSKEPDASGGSLCLSAAPLGPPGSPRAEVGGGTVALASCSSPAAQFSLALPGHIVHAGTGLCLTVGRCAASPPPAPDSKPPSGTAPCDIYASVGSPCVAAHSMVRALYAAYSGPLYSVLRSSDNTTMNISVQAAGGHADASVQDTFCAATDCVVFRIWDQSPGNRNHLGIYGPDKGVNASADMHTVGGHPVYSAYFSKPGMGYRNINTTFIAGDARGTGAGNKIPVGEEPESMYSVFGGKHFNNHCCFDYGNAEANAHDNGDGTMESLYFGSDEAWWREMPANKSGPWIMADIENGMYAGDDDIDPDAIPTWDIDYVTAMLKGRVCELSLKGGDATKGELTTLYDGVRPQHNLYQVRSI